MPELLSHFKISPLFIEQGTTQIGQWTLRKFQEEIIDPINQKKDALLTAPTGSGKTLTLLLGQDGFVGLYPNNTLLLDQQKSINKTLKEALNAETIYDSEIMKIYELGENHKLPNSERRKVAVILLTGKYIEYEKDNEGNLIPKRLLIKRRIIDKICYPEKTGKTPYLIIMTTPDTALMIMTGIYRDFKKVAHTIYNALQATTNNIDLTLHTTVTELGPLAEIRTCLLKHPWFIDEYHLYGTYETTMITPLLKVYRDYIGWEEPIILSSATPKGTLFENLTNLLKPKEITCKTSNNGTQDTLIRGETEVEVYTLNIPSKNEITKWLSLGYYLNEIINTKIDEIKQALSKGNTFIVVDRVNQVSQIVELFHNKYNIDPECAVSIKPLHCKDKSNLIVGSESISQGIDRPNVIYGILTAYNWATLIQRFGRIGRKTNSKIILAIPSTKKKYKIEELNNKTTSYNDFITTIKETYTNIDLTRKPETKSIREIYETRAKLIQYTTIITYTKISKPGNTFTALIQNIKNDTQILKKFHGPPTLIPAIMTFRPNGPQVAIEKPDKTTEITDLGTVLRNYKIKYAYTKKYKTNNTENEYLTLGIDFTPEHSQLQLEPQPHINPDNITKLNNTITTIEELTNQGYTLIITTKTEKIKITKIPPNIQKQPIAIIPLPNELTDYYTNTGNGITILTGGIKPKHTLGLFL